MEMDNLKKECENLSKDETIRKSFEYGKETGKYEERQKKEKKLENQINLKTKIASFMKNEFPVILLCLGVIILIAGLWINYRLIITGGVISIFGWLLDKL